MNVNNDTTIEPIISVVLPVYNGGEYLKHSVASVLEQNFPHYEFLIMDDLSNDGSYEWLKQLKDDRIKLYRNPQNKGLFYNLNFLIAQSSSRLIKLWAQDDIMYPQCLDAFVDFHQQHPAIGFSYSGRNMIDEKGTIKGNKRVDNTPEIISTELHAQIAYYTGSIAGNIANVCINKNALNKIGQFNEQMKISADFDMWVRLAEYYDTGFIKQALIMLRDHSGQLSRNEKYYINHVKEDLKVYGYLDSYVNKEICRSGRKMLRNKKFIFYYTLMLKSLLNGKGKAVYEYYKTLSEYDNFFLISVAFFKQKITKKEMPKPIQI